VKSVASVGVCMHSGLCRCLCSRGENIYIHILIVRQDNGEFA
jgi:hypothetical protein